MTTATLSNPNLTGVLVVAFIFLGIGMLRLDLWALAEPYTYAIGGKPTSGGTASSGGSSSSGGTTSSSGGASSGGTTARSSGGAFSSGGTPSASGSKSIL